MAQTLTQEDLDAIADAVWNEAYNQHTTAGTFGKLMDLLRKANMTVDGTVTSTISPTTLQFSTDVAGYPNSAFAHAVLLFVNGSSVAEQNSPITTYVATNGVVTLEEPLTSAPIAGDEFIIIAGSHVHSVIEISQGIQASGVSVVATQADDGTISLYDSRAYNGTAHSKLSFNVEKNYTSADDISFKIYNKDNQLQTFQTVTATASSSVLIQVDSFTVSLTPTPSFTGNPLVFECRYALIADFAGSEETIASGDCFIFAGP